MTDQREPRTKAGRRVYQWYVTDVDDNVESDFLGAIRAIEAEAARDYAVALDDCQRENDALRAAVTEVGIIDRSNAALIIEKLGLAATPEPDCEARLARLQERFDALAGLADATGRVLEATPPVPALEVERLVRALRAAIVALPQPTLGLAGGVNRGEAIDAIDQVFAALTRQDAER